MHLFGVVSGFSQVQVIEHKSSTWQNCRGQFLLFFFLSLPLSVSITRSETVHISISARFRVGLQVCKVTKQYNKQMTHGLTQIDCNQDCNWPWPQPRGLWFPAARLAGSAALGEWAIINCPSSHSCGKSWKLSIFDGLKMVKSTINGQFQKRNFNPNH